MKPIDPKLEALARLIAATRDSELDCGALLDRVAAYLEDVKAGRAPDASMREVAQHLTVCPECHEEFVALLRAEGLDPAALGVVSPNGG